MEDVLEVYQRRYGDNEVLVCEVLVCLDETSKQQVKETRRPRPARPGAAGSYDYEYERNGVSNLFMLFAPLEGWRRVEVTDRRTKADWGPGGQAIGGRGLPAQGPYCAGDGQLEHPPPVLAVRGI